MQNIACLGTKCLVKQIVLDDTKNIDRLLLLEDVKVVMLLMYNENQLQFG